MTYPTYDIGVLKYHSMAGPPFTAAEEQEIRAIFRRPTTSSDLAALAAFQTRDSERYEGLYQAAHPPKTLQRPGSRRGDGS